MLLKKPFTQQSGLKFPDHIKTGQGSILGEGSILPESTPTSEPILKIYVPGVSRKYRIENCNFLRVVQYMIF